MATKGVQLDVEKIRNLLNILGKNQTWLAEKIGKGRQWVHYDLSTGCLSRINLYAEVFNLDARDLIK